MNRLDISVVPEKTGVYLFKSAKGEVLYVGKARNLRSRLRAYLRPESDSRPRVVYLMEEASDVDFVITASEKEAFLLENNLIKRHRPPYNVYYRDDKDYLCVRIDLNEPFPRFRLVRKVERDGAVYFGPYSSAKKIRYLLNVLGKLFPMRTCTDVNFRNRKKPCMQHQIKRCPGPCVGLVGREEYMRNVRDALKMLRGDFGSIRKKLNREMRDYSRNLRYEEAAEVRDRIGAIEDLSATQSVVNATIPDADIFGLYREKERGAVAMVLLRNCRVIDVRCFMVNARDYEEEELLGSLLAQYYVEGAYIPKEIVVPTTPEVAFFDPSSFVGPGKLAKVKVPLRGARKELLKMAEENAGEFFEARRKRELHYDEVMGRMTGKLQLRQRPARVECYDVSHHGGAHAVGSLVVFEYGVPLRSGYRKFRVRGVEGIDDYSMVSEIIERRLTRGEDFGRLPDLMVIDGGKGHLSAAVSVVGPSGKEIDIVAIAKEKGGPLGGKDDRVYLPGRKNPLLMRADDPVLLFLKRVRDEAHRFALSYHRSRDEKEKTRSLMLDFPGIGRKRVGKLIQIFGSPAGVLKRSPGEISSLLKISSAHAEAFLAYLQKEYGKSYGGK